MTKKRWKVKHRWSGMWLVTCSHGKLHEVTGKRLIVAMGGRETGNNAKVMYFHAKALPVIS